MKYDMEPFLVLDSIMYKSGGCSAFSMDIRCGDIWERRRKALLRCAYRTEQTMHQAVRSAATMYLVRQRDTTPNGAKLTLYLSRRSYFY